VITVVYCIYPLTVGILGIRSRKRPEKITGCFVMGIILVALNLIGAIPKIVLIAAVGFVEPTILLTSVPSFVIAVLYTVGAGLVRRERNRDRNQVQNREDAGGIEHEG
jgi:hypothetical protein